MGFPYGPHCARWHRASLAQLSARRLKRSLARSSRNVAMPSLVRTSADIVVVLHTHRRHYREYTLSGAVHKTPRSERSCSTEATQHVRSRLRSEGWSRTELPLVRAIFAITADRKRSKISARSRAISRVIASPAGGTSWMVDRGISHRMRDPSTVAQTLKLLPSQ